MVAVVGGGELEVRVHVAAIRISHKSVVDVALF